MGHIKKCAQKVLKFDTSLLDEFRIQMVSGEFWGLFWQRREGGSQVMTFEILLYLGVQLCEILKTPSV